MKKWLTVWIALLLAFSLILSGSAEGEKPVDQLLDEYKATEEINEKLVLIRRVSEENAKSTETPVWNLPSFSLGDALNGILPENWEEYPYTETDGFPEEAVGRPCIIVHGQELLAYLLVRFPAEMIASSLEEAEYAIVIDTTRVESGYTYNPPGPVSYHLDYFGYLLNLRTGKAVRFWYARSYAAISGKVNELDAKQLTADQIWDGIRPGLLTDIQVPQEDGSTLVFMVSGAVCSLKSYEGEPVNLVVPAEVQGYPVTAVEAESFKNCNSLKTLSLPDSVTRIGKSAFEDCRNLEEIHFSRGLTEIESNAFCRTGLKEVRLPDGIERLGYESFGWIDSLEVVSLPPSFLENGCDSAFSGCDRLARVIVEEGKTELMSTGFLPWNGPKYLYLPGSLEFGLEYCYLDPGVTVCAPEGSYALTCAQEMGLNTIPCETPEDIPDVQSVTEGDFEFILLEQEAHLIKYTGSHQEEITVPGEVSGRPVTTVMDNVFSLESDVRVIRFPASVRLVKGGALYWGTYNKHAELELYIPNPDVVLEDGAIRALGLGTETIKLYAPAEGPAQDYIARYNEKYNYGPIVFVEWTEP